MRYIMSEMYRHEKKDRDEEKDKRIAEVVKDCSEVEQKKRATRQLRIEDIIEYREKGLTLEEISKLCNCRRATIAARLKKARAGGLALYQAKESKILAYHRRRLLESLEDDDFSKATLSQKAVAFGIFVDKQRLLDEKSTSNVSLIHQNIAILKKAESIENEEDDTILARATVDGDVVSSITNKTPV